MIYRQLILRSYFVDLVKTVVLETKPCTPIVDEWLLHLLQPLIYWSTKHHLFSYLALRRVMLASNMNMFPRFIHMYELLRLLCMTRENDLQIEGGRNFKKAKKIESMSGKAAARTSTDDVFADLFAGASKWTTKKTQTNLHTHPQPALPSVSEWCKQSQGQCVSVNAPPCHTWTGLIQSKSLQTDATDSTPPKTFPQFFPLLLLSHSDLTSVWPSASIPPSLSPSHSSPDKKKKIATVNMHKALSVRAATFGTRQTRSVLGCWERSYVDCPVGCYLLGQRGGKSETQREKNETMINNQSHLLDQRKANKLST